MTPTVLLSVEGLAKAFGAAPLFEDLSLSLAAGDRLVVMHEGRAAQIGTPRFEPVVNPKIVAFGIVGVLVLVGAALLIGVALP